ncbi:MAG: DUF4192 domain-containing protein [Propionibacteriaceae bacterium]|nr:DUF4192 domain-containing protein [Propionibacteriaceae bacterium]
MNSSKTTPVRLRAGSPAQLVATLPYLFGFRPDNSVIILGLQGRRIDGTARVDASVVLAAGFDVEVLRGRLSSITAPSHQIIVVAWIDDVDDARRAINVVGNATGLPDMAVIVSHGRCQADGGPWQECVDHLAEADEAGLTVLDSRDALEASVAGPSDAEWATMADAWACACHSVEALTPGKQRARARRLMEQGLEVPGGLSSESCLELAALARQGHVRDVMTALITIKSARHHTELWRLVVTKAPAEAAPAVLGLLGLAAWLMGEGALQVCCMQRGLAIDPSHSLLRLIEAINVMGVHPREWARVRRLGYMGA